MCDVHALVCYLIGCLIFATVFRLPLDRGSETQYLFWSLMQQELLKLSEKFVEFFLGEYSRMAAVLPTAVGEDPNIVERFTSVDPARSSPWSTQRGLLVDTK